MPNEFVSLEYPPGSACSSRVLCRPVGKRRYAAWLGDEFLGHAIARVDGMWTGKTPREETFPGRLDREAALLSLLALRRPVVEPTGPVEPNELGHGFPLRATAPILQPGANA